MVATSRRGDPFNSSWALHFPGEKPTARKALAVATSACRVGLALPAFGFPQGAEVLTAPPSPGDSPSLISQRCLFSSSPSPSYYLLNRKPWVTPAVM